MAHIEAVLHMHCVGKQALRSSSIKLIALRSSSGHDDQDDASNVSNMFLFGKMVVHGSPIN